MYRTTQTIRTSPSGCSCNNCCNPVSELTGMVCGLDPHCRKFRVQTSFLSHEGKKAKAKCHKPGCSKKPQCALRGMQKNTKCTSQISPGMLCRAWAITTSASKHSGGGRCKEEELTPNILKQFIGADLIISLLLQGASSCWNCHTEENGTSHRKKDVTELKSDVGEKSKMIPFV